MPPFWKNKKKETPKAKPSFSWRVLCDADQLEQVLERSREHPQLIFKHSTRCGISGMMLRRFQATWGDAQDQAEFHLLDVLAERPVSNVVAERLGVVHQSPQVIMLKDSEVLEVASHSGIEDIRPERA